MNRNFATTIRFARRLAWPALLLVLCMAFYWKLVLTNQYTWLDNPDLSYMEVPRFQFIAGEVRHSRLPLWDPHLWFGQPMLGQITGSAYPVNWLLALPPFKQGRIQFSTLNWYFVLIHFQAALFCYLLCRDLKRSRPASVAAGLVFALGGYLADAMWAQLINGALWAPLVFLFLLRALRGKRPVSSAALSGVFLGVSWLSGHHEVPIYMATAAGIAWLGFIFTRPGERLKMAGLALLSFLFTALAAGYQVIPGYEYGRVASRWAGAPNPLTWTDPVPYYVHQNLSFTPASLLGIIAPGLTIHISAFIGVAAFVLAAVGLATGWRRQRILLFFALLALGGLLFAMAAGNVFHGVLYSLLPVFGKARAPARAIALFSFAVAPLVAFGFDAVFRNANRTWLRRAVRFCGGLAAAILLFALLATYVTPFNPRSAIIATALGAALAACLLAAWDRRIIGRSAAAAALILLILFELGPAFSLKLSNQADPNRPGHLAKLSQHDDIAALFRWQKEPVRVAVNDTEIPYNFGDWHGVDTTGGYLAGITTNIYRRSTHLPRIQDLLAVNFTVDRTPSREGQELVSGSNSGLNIYRNPTAFPRAWIVHQAVMMHSDAELQRALEDPQWDLRAKAPMLGPVPSGITGCASAGSAKVVSMKTTSVRIETQSECGGMLVLADVNFPGWQATVDGNRAEIHEVYGALRGVAVGSGAHRVEFNYRPASAVAGGLMSLAGMLGAAVLALSDRRRRA